MTRVAGIDIARGAWLVVYLDSGRFDGAEIVDRLAGAEIAAGVVAIDIPLDLPAGTIGRPAEEEARRMLGARRNSVFRSLPVDLYEADYTESTREVARAKYGMSFSKQSWNLRAAVADAADARTTGWYETHPELAFRQISGAPLDSKKVWSGVRQRLDCLAAVGIDLPAIDGDLHPDDALDAAVCAFVASRIANGTAERVPETGQGPHIWY
jgi:predicted RNase H-like nuclease